MSAPRPRGDPELDHYISSASITTALRSKIVTSLWGQSPRQGVEDYSAYFEFFARECEAWRSSPCRLAIQTYRDFLDLVQHLTTHREDARASLTIKSFFPPLSPANVLVPDTRMPLTTEQILRPVAQRHTNSDETSIRYSIDLAVSLWLMVSPMTPDMIISPGRSPLSWDETDSLDDFVAKSFPQAMTTVPSPLSSSLSLYSLKCVGFDIHWVDHLPDHLYLNEDLKSIKIYHHACVLQSHRAAGSVK